MEMNRRRALAFIIMLVALMFAAGCTSQEQGRDSLAEAGNVPAATPLEADSEGRAGEVPELGAGAGSGSGQLGAEEATEAEGSEGVGSKAVAEEAVDGAGAEQEATPGSAGGEENPLDIGEPAEPTDQAEPAHARQRNLPEGFVYMDEVIVGAQYELRYLTDNNFVGRPIEGYVAPVPIMSAAGAEALAQVQAALEPDGYGLKIFDAYRPQKAVNHFKAWSADAEDTLMKEQYYPELDKANLFKLGYIASKSGHSRGGTVDLTLVVLETGAEVDMGGPYDFFGEISHYSASGISKEQRENRARLRRVMEQFGFKGYSKEWWHFTLVSEPFPNQYFDFDVE